MAKLINKIWVLKPTFNGVSYIGRSNFYNDFTLVTINDARLVRFNYEKEAKEFLQYYPGLACVIREVTQTLEFEDE